MPNVSNPWWRDRDDSEEIAAVLADMADELNEKAETRRERAEVGRVRKAAAQLREQHDIPAPPPIVRRAPSTEE
jgi:hypothetical protein